MCNSQHDLSVTIKAIDVEKKQVEATKVKFDTDGSLMSGSCSDAYNPISFMFFGSRQATPKSKDDEFKHKFELDDKSTLEIIGVILMNKNTERLSLIAKLKKYGVTE